MKTLAVLVVFMPWILTLFLTTIGEFSFGEAANVVGISIAYMFWPVIMGLIMIYLSIWGRK